MKKLTQLLVLPLLFASLLSACGWHLRGAIDLPANLQNVHLQSAAQNSELATDLKRALTSNGVAVSESIADSQFNIILEKESYERRAVSVGDSALAEEYELIMEVPYRIENAEGEEIAATSTARVIRSYSYNRNAVVAMNEEQELIKREMRSNIVQQVLRRLRFSATAAPSAP